VDIGGTFTDFVIFDPGKSGLETFKLLSTPDDPARAVLAGLARIFPPAQAASGELIHGSTVATNALLERKGAATALISTAGFEDVLQIGRQNRPSLYDLTADPPPPLVAARQRFPVHERVDHTGRVLQELEQDELGSLLERITRTSARSIAVCLLFSFLRPEHEQRIGRVLRQAGFTVSLSSEILPEFREYERTSTTVVNAYVAPVLDRYLTRLESVAGRGLRLRIMQSNGGSLSPAEARRQAVRCILSGPAGGVVGCRQVGRTAFPKKRLQLITFDMGGTSTDVSLIDGEPQVTTEAVVSGCPIHLPLLDIHTIGAGGGSIARVDEGGALRVGPESAGADPGPACYGRGELPTVTDANLVLGRIPSDFFLGGEMPLFPRRARQALERLGSKLQLSAAQAALGVIAVANAHMERALRLISVERGRDPRSFSLLSFGGAGGLHAADLGRCLGIPVVLVPPLAATLSAFGMLTSEVVKDYSLTVMLPGTTSNAEIRARLEPLVQRGRQEVRAEGIAAGAIRIERLLDLRYRGQSYELTIPFGAAWRKEFLRAHVRAYGYAHPESPLELVNLRVKAVGTGTPPPLPRLHSQTAGQPHAALDRRSVTFSTGRLLTPFYRAEDLGRGQHLSGPAVILRRDTTILVGPTDQARLDGYGNLFIEVGA
jgi:N-methylhydantoinase A